MSEDLMFQPVTELAASVREGDVSARELVETSLQAIDRLNGELNAFVTLCDERALAEADAIEPGDSRPLAGVPIAIKDLVALTEGVRTTMGMDAMEEWVPSIDSALVRRLREAGVIIVGKTNTPEFGILPVTEPHRFGPARNPWDTSRTPGGSSGGSAAAVAAGMVPVAHANDGGGSIRIPASCAGSSASSRAAGGSRLRPAQRVRRRHRDRGLREPHGRRHRARARRDGRLRARRPLLGAPTAAPVRRCGRPRSRRAAHRLHHRGAERRAGARRLRRRRSRDRRAARVARARGRGGAAARPTRATSRTSSGSGPPGSRTGARATAYCAGSRSTSTSSSR